MKHRATRIRGVRRDLDEELSFHFAETVEELMSGGMSREQAEAEAYRRFGDASRYRSQLERLDREAEAMRRRRNWLDATVHTLQSALRSVARSPGMSASIILVLALGIGANATMFATIDRLLLSAPNHIRDPGSVKRVFVERRVTATAERRTGILSYMDFVDLRDAGFADIAGYTAAGEILGEGPEARSVDGWTVTGNFWDLLGVRPHIGRFFTEAEDVAGGEPVVVLSYDLWRRDFGGDASVLGRTVRLSTMLYTVVGVAPKGFTGAELSQAEIWLPFHHRFVHVYAPFSGGQALGRELPIVSALVRLAPGVPPERVAEQARAIYLAGRQEFIERGSEDADQRIMLASVSGPKPGGLRPPGASADAARDGAVALWLSGVSLLVLLIACANVANLLLGRSIRRRRETAIRLALGVSRGRLVAHTMTEGLLLAVLGAVAALALTHWGGWLMQRTLLPDVDWGAPVTGRVLRFVLVAAAGAGLLSAVAPAFQIRRYDVGDVMRATAGGITRSSSRMRAWLAVAQAGLSVVLLVGAGLFVRSLGRAQATQLGFAADRTLFLEPWFLTGSVLDLSTPEAQLFFQRAPERLASIPGVAAVAVGDVPFFGGDTPRLRATGYDSVTQPGGGRPYRFRASATYFRTVGLDVLEGRGIQAIDRPGSEPVAVVSRSMAGHLWPAEAALGKCLFVGGGNTCSRIVGVVSDSKVRSIDDRTTFTYYLPYEPGGAIGGPIGLIVRTSGEPTRMAGAIQRELMSLDDRVRYVRVHDLRGDFVDSNLRSWKLGATLFSAFGLLAMIVAMIGLYSVLAFDVEQRTREIGLRTALGASRRAVVRIFIARAMKLTALGTTAGMAVALVLAPRVQDLLFQTSARDPVTFGATALMLILVGLCAGGLPAWRGECRPECDAAGGVKQILPRDNQRSSMRIRSLYVRLDVRCVPSCSVRTYSP